MVDSLILPRQRALTSISPHAGNPGVVVPKRAFARTIMTAGLGGGDKSGFSSPILFTFGAMAPLAALSNQDIAQVSHDVSDSNVEIVFASTPLELADDFWYSVTFRGLDKNWDNFTLLREKRAAFDNTGATFTIWSFLSVNSDVPFIDADVYELTWRRQ